MTSGGIVEHLTKYHPIHSNVCHT